MTQIFSTFITEKKSLPQLNHMCRILGPATLLKHLVADDRIKVLQAKVGGGLKRQPAMM